jgi:molecular chaperone DnaK
MDKGTGREQKITIQSSAVSARKKSKRCSRSGGHAAEDARKKEEAEVRNTADTLAYTAEKTLRDNKDKIPPI